MITRFVQMTGMVEWIFQLGKLVGIEMNSTIAPDTVASGLQEWKKIQDMQLLPSELAEAIEAQLQKKQALFTSSQVIGLPDFLPFGFFGLGQARGDAVCCLFRQLRDADEVKEIMAAATSHPKIKKWLEDYFEVTPSETLEIKIRSKPIPIGTGFLIGDQYVMTNYHVISDQALLGSISAKFRYENNWFGTSNSIDVKFDPKFHHGNPELDYVILKLVSSDGKKIIDSGIRPIPLPIPAKSEYELPIPRINAQESGDMISELSDQNLKKYLTENGYPGDPIHIIQHPSGRPKEIVLFNNVMNTIYQDFIEYETDTEPGSSGSPLFNNKWNLIGLHRAAIFGKKDEEDSIKVSGFLGIRLDKILDDIRVKKQPELQDLVDRYLNPPTQHTQRVFILAGDNRSDVLGEEDATLEFEAMTKLAEKLKAELSSVVMTVEIITGKGTYALEDAIKKINDKREAGIQDIAIQLLTDQLDAGYGDRRGASIYYYGNNAKRLNNATIIADQIKTTIADRGHTGDTPITIGTFSDLTISNRGLGFCRRVLAPSFVIFVGFLSNEDDRTYIESLKDERSNHADILAQALANGIKKIFETLN